jgi:phage shock protein PspC (stress-responsive transcriptional regulator)
MPLLSSPDKVVMGDQHGIPQGFDIGYYFVHIYLRLFAFCQGCFLYFLTMFISAGKIKNVISLHPFEAGYTISGHSSIGMADVKIIAGIIYGGGDIEMLPL